MPPWPSPALAVFLPQGTKLVGAGAIGSSQQGTSVALSADGSTALVGAPSDNSGAGAAWVFVRSVSGVWSEQAKLVGSGASGAAQQGVSVALSADGNTALVGGHADNGYNGAAWVFTRSAGVWSQQGAKLVGLDLAGSSLQGYSVALSGNGDRAIVGGPGDNSNTGAGFAWKRIGGVWSRDGGKLIGAGAVGNPSRGWGVAISADGLTAAISGPGDNGNAGAVWTFSYSGSAWAEQGTKRVVSAASGVYFGRSLALAGDGLTFIASGEGVGNSAWAFAFSGGAWSLQSGPLPMPAASGDNEHAVALSADGRIAMVGSRADANGGGAWFYRRNAGGEWRAIGIKRAPYGASGLAQFGSGVALAADGRTALIGGPADASNLGAAWPFALRVAHDLNGNGASDLLWRHSSGQTYAWLMSGTSYSAASVGDVDPAWGIIGQRDFDGDGKGDILWASGSHVVLWLMNGATLSGYRDLGSVPGWFVAGLGDFDGNGHADILWRNAPGDLAIWFFTGGNVTGVASVGNVATNWAVAAVADLNGDGRSDFVWREAGGLVAYWYMNGASASATGEGDFVPTNWTIVGTGDFNGDGRDDLLWREVGGATAAWLMTGFGAGYTTANYGVVPASWVVQQTGDYDGDVDATSDVLWRDGSGTLAMWQLSAGAVSAVTVLGTIAPSWVVQNWNAN